MRHVFRKSCVLAMLVIVPIASAHHAVAPHFDRTRTVTKQAVFKELKLVNPHAYIYFTITENGQTEDWRCEMQAAAQLRRQGWTEQTLKPGDAFTLTGSPAWREDNVCVVRAIELPDGTFSSRNRALNASGVNGYGSVRAERADIKTRTDILLNGQPNISGNWRTVSFGWSSPLSSWGRGARYDSTRAGERAAEDYDVRYDDPVLRCHYVNLIQGWNTDAHVNRIEQTGDTVLIKYGFMDVTRTVHLNKTEFPKDIEPSETGYSIGRWDGDTLIVKTRNFTPGVLDNQSGIMHSNQLSVAENFYINPKTNYLMREYELTDPLYLEGSFKGSDGQELVTLPFVEFGCTELSGANNIRPGETITFPRGTGITQGN